jgi:hypothetical protein
MQAQPHSGKLLNRRPLLSLVCNQLDSTAVMIHPRVQLLCWSQMAFSSGFSRPHDCFFRLRNDMLSLR